MTVETLQEIREFLSHVVVYGEQQTRLLQAIDSLDAFIYAVNKVRQAA